MKEGAKFANMKLMHETRDYWHDVENLCIRKDKPPITDWEEMKENLMRKKCSSISPSYLKKRDLSKTYHDNFLD